MVVCVPRAPRGDGMKAEAEASYVAGFPVPLPHKRLVSYMPLGSKKNLLTKCAKR